MTINNYNLQLPPAAVQVIMACLAEQQYKQVAPVMNLILSQTDAQEKAASDAEALAKSQAPVTAQTPPAQLTSVAKATSALGQNG